jgi:hypothetical protein
VYEQHHGSNPNDAGSRPSSDYFIYVDASRSAEGDGSWASPYRNISNALAHATDDYAIVQVADGIYTGAQNRNLAFPTNALMIMSAGGAAVCILDCGGHGYGMSFAGAL